MKTNVLLLPLLLACAMVVRGELVHVYQQTAAGAATNRLSDTVLETTKSYSTQTAPAIDGWIFTHWSISTAQTFSDRDRWGRALDAAPYTLYEETTLTANYLPASQDSDADGVADGHELYWYGSLAVSAPSDTDGDGFSFAAELAMGTNPLFADEFAPGGIEWADSALLLYNPYSIQPYTLRSDPEGALFATTETYVRPGTVVTTPSYDHDSTIFAYWDMNGPRQADRWGRALDTRHLHDALQRRDAHGPHRRKRAGQAGALLVWEFCGVGTVRLRQRRLHLRRGAGDGHQPALRGRVRPRRHRMGGLGAPALQPILHPALHRALGAGRRALRLLHELGPRGHHRDDGNLLPDILLLRLLDAQRRTTARPLGPGARCALLRHALQRGGDGGSHRHR